MQSFETHGMSLLFSRHIFIYFQHSHVFGERGGCYNLTPSDVCIVVLCCELFANPYSFSTDRHNPTQTVYMLHSTNTIYTYIKKQTRIQNSSSPKLFFLFQRSKILGLILVVDGDILKSSGNIR